MPTEKELTNLVINKIENPEVFKYMQNNSLINADELYLVGGDDDVATQTENGLMSAEDKTKLDGIEKGAEVNVQTDWNEKDSTSDAFLKNKPTSLPANGGNADTVNGHTVKSNVPENAVFTDTTYDAAGENLGLVKSGGDVTIQDGTITIPSLGDKANKSTTLAGYGIEDAKISDGVITLGSNTITPVTSVNGKSGASVTLDKTNIGLNNVDNIKQYSANNPPPYPVTSVSGKTGAVTLTKANVGLNNVDNVKQYSASNPPPYPVTSVNGHTGAITVHEVPSVTTTDNGKFLRVVNGAWAATTAPNKFTFTATAG